MAGIAETEVAYAQFLAIGGSIDGLCRDGEIPRPGSAACDICCLANLAVLPAQIARPLPFRTEALPSGAAWLASLPGAVFSNPAAPVRAPPMIA